MASQPQTPFYIQVTPLKIDYKDRTGESKSQDLPLITLPPGTVLFRGIKIPNPNEPEKQDVRYFYRDFLGDPEGKDSVCLKPTHNVFFYPFPYVAFGADTIGKEFQAMQAVVLVQPVTIVSNIAPTNIVRSDAYGFENSTFPYKRCDDESFKSHCHELSPKEIEALRFDNCVDPTFQKESGVRGWMAIADRDSIKPKITSTDMLLARKTGKPIPTAKTSSMGSYLLNLEKRQPGSAPLAISWMYSAIRTEDKRAQAGFPEIALYPYRIHPGDRLIKRTCKTQDHALILMEREAALNNLNYLPLATFTKDGTVDMVKGHFSYECLGVSSNTFAIPPSDQQGDIERKMREWMDYCQTTGLDLPFYGSGKLSFDMRTGFYVFPQVIPKTIRVRLPEKDDRGRSEIPYEYLTLPLDNEEAKLRVLTYMLMFRSFIPGEYMKMFGLMKKFGVPRAMVLNRPPTLLWIFQELELPLPKEYKHILGRAAAQYKANTGTKSKKEMEADAAAARELAIALQRFPPGGNPFYKIYKDNGELGGQYTFEQWKALADDEYLRILGLAGRAPSVAEKMEKQYKYKKNVPLTPEAKAPPSSPVTGNLAAQPTAKVAGENIPEAVRGKRDYLFGAQIAASNLKFIQMDETALYSVTDGKTAIEQTNLIIKKIDEIFGGSVADDCYITDGTANVGGNTISFGKEFAQVNSVEIGPLRASLLANNIMVAGTQNNTTVHVADYTKIWNKLQQNIIFMDPPWGGTNYKSKDTLDMFLGPTNVIDLIREMVDANAANLIAMKAPVNYNIAALKAKISDKKIDVIPMKKQLLILIPVTNSIQPLGIQPQTALTPPLYGTGALTPPYSGYGAMGATTPPLYGAMGATTPPLYGAMGATTPLYGGIGATTPPFYGAMGSTTPPLLGIGSTTPPYGGIGATTPVFMPTGELTEDERKYYNQAKAYIQQSRERGEEPSPPYHPSLNTQRMLNIYEMAKSSSTPPIAGGRRRKINKTRSGKSGRRSYRVKTRKISKGRNSVEFAKAFKSVWSAYIKAQAK